MNARQIILTAGAMAALAAPAAQAMPLGDDGGSSIVAYVPFKSDFGPAAASTPALSARAVQAMGLRYEAMAKAYGSGSVSQSAIARLSRQESILRRQEIASNYGSTAVRPDDRSGIHGVGGSPAEPTAVATPGSSFDWTWVAAGSSSAFVLLLGCGAFLLASRRHSGTALTS